MRTKNVVAVLLGLFLLPAAVARAEGPQPGQPGYVDPQQQQYQQQQPMGDPNAQYQQQPQPAPEEQTSNEQAQQGRGIEYGGYLYVPIFVTAPAPGITADPGIGLMGRVGWEFGSGFAAELTIGGQYNSFTLDFLGVSGAGSFTNLFVGAGLRFSFLNASALVPFVGAGLQLNFWGAVDDTGSSDNNSIAFGLNGLFGLAYELSADLALEAGLRVDFTTAGKNDAGGTFFDGGQVYLSPFIGATLYY